MWWRCCVSACVPVIAVIKQRLHSILEAAEVRRHTDAFLRIAPNGHFHEQRHTCRETHRGIRTCKGTHASVGCAAHDVLCVIQMQVGGPRPTEYVEQQVKQHANITHLYSIRCTAPERHRPSSFSVTMYLHTSHTCHPSHTLSIYIYTEP